MAIIREVTDLRLPSSTARAHWSGFVGEMITASNPGEPWLPFRWRRVERESDRDVVRFEHTAPGMTRMTVELDEPGESADSPTVATIRPALRVDLDWFCAEWRVRPAARGVGERRRVRRPAGQFGSAIMPSLSDVIDGTAAGAPPCEVTDARRAK